MNKIKRVLKLLGLVSIFIVTAGVLIFSIGNRYNYSSIPDPDSIPDYYFRPPDSYESEDPEDDRTITPYNEERDDLYKEIISDLRLDIKKRDALIQELISNGQKTSATDIIMWVSTFILNVFSIIAIIKGFRKKEVI